MGYLYYINIILLCIILSNIILQAIKLHEGFDVSSPEQQALQKMPIIRAQLRPCTIQLTEDTDICDKLSDIYEMSDSQLQVLLNTMKKNNADPSAYSMLQYVKANKNTIPINSCKLQLAQWKEVKEAYISPTSNLAYPYKSITKTTDYNTSNLAGYCLYDVSDAANMNAPYIDYLQDTNNLNSTQLYQLYQFNTSADIKTITDLYCSTPSATPIVPVDSTLTFMRLHAYVDDTSTLLVNKIDMVAYDPLQNVFQPKMVYDISKFFEFQYTNKQIILGFAKVPLSIYTFSFDICKRIKQYTMTNNINFSFADFTNLFPKLVENSVDLGDAHDIQDLKQAINTKINDIIQRHNTLNNQIQAYTENITELTTNYNQLNDLPCTDEKCVIQLQYLLSKRDVLQAEKAQLETELLKQKEDHIMYAELSKKIKDTSFTLENINEMLGPFGVQIPYNMYSDLISNDDCIYLQI